MSSNFFVPCLGYSFIKFKEKIRRGGFFGLIIMNMRILRPSAVEIEVYAKVENEIKRNVDKNPTENVVEYPINEGYDRNEDQLRPEIL